MLSLRCIRPLLLVFFIYKVSAQWPVAPPQPSSAYRWLADADWWSETRRSPLQSAIADSDNDNGNTLAATELIAEVLEAVRPDDVSGKDSTARAATGWFRFWLKRQQQQRQQDEHRQKQQQQQQRRQQDDSLESDGRPKFDIQVMAQRNRNGNENENDVNSFEAIAADWRPSMRMNAQPGVVTLKRSPPPIGEDSVRRAQPHYPYALIPSDSDPDASWQPATLRNYKRERGGTESKANNNAFVPSISTGAMTHLGTFFKDLTKNVLFSEQSQLGESQKKLLSGVHPLKTLQEEIARDHETMTSTNKTAAFLHAIRSYRPSQKIRSLVSMNPKGYHGSQFIDPNYMWLGLGK